MAGELVASAVVDELVSKLASGLWSELGLLWNFSNDLQDMKSTLQSIEAVLNDAEKRSFSDNSVRLWLKRLKAAAYDIEDMFDELPTHNRLLYSPIMAHKLKGMRKRLDKIAEERSKYNLIKDEEAISYEKKVIEERKTTSVEFKDDVLGRDQEATQIINRLLMLTPTNQSTALSVIPIVGVGGLGKTTLARLIYNDDRTKEFFELRIWVHAVNLEVEKLVEAILSKVEAENRNNPADLDSKRTRAKEILQGKTYLIVLDDVWSEDWQKWEAFKQILKCGDQRESKIIVTTRSERVSSIMDATETQHKLKPLSDDVCLELFERRAFGLTGAKDNHLASIGKEIVKKCRGVPLTANSLGGILHFERGEAAWKKVRDSALWELKEEEGSSGSSSENKIISSLKLSYHYLPSPLKLCFVYCSSYPRAFKLHKDMLIQQWIAQRFIQTEDEIQAVQIGDRYVNYLLSISFLEEEKEIDRSRFKDVRTYMKMHDLVYDLARWVAGDEVSDALESGKYNAMECRYASVINYKKASKELGKALPRKVRALHFQDCTISLLPKGIFSYTKCLRVLDFTSCYLDELPTSIYKLKQLRYLRLPYRIKEVDERIGKLYNLIYLEINDCHSLSKIPNSIGSLQRLNSLKLAYCPDLTSLPESLGDLVNLVTLDINKCSIITLPASIGKLHNLIYLEINDCDSLSKIPNSIGSLQRLNSLKLAYCPHLTSLSESLGDLVNLVTLDIYRCSIVLIPYSIGSLQRLNSLKLAYCPHLTSLPESLGDLVNLVTLDINNCSIITLPASIGKLHKLIDLDLSSSVKLLELPDSIGRLKKLNSLKLYGCHNLGSLPESLSNLMELRTLDVRGCAMLDLDELRKATCNMRHLKIQRDESLELLELDTSELKLHLVDGNPEEGHVVHYVSDAKRINLKERGGSIKSLTYRCGGGNKKGRAAAEAMLEALQPHQNLQELCIKSYGGTVFPSWMRRQMESFLPNLVKIILERISNCEHLPMLGQLPKLAEMFISYMPKLRRISEEEFCGARNTTSGVASFPSLKRLEIGYMDELEEWVTAAMAGDDGERGASLFPCLEDLSIGDCPKLRRIHSCILPSLKRLKLEQLWDLEEWVTAERGASLFPCLEELIIRGCDKLQTIRPCIPPSVRRLTLSGNNLHLLTFLDVPEISLLKHLHIYDDDLNSFPESIRRLTSLETLELKWCKSLTTIPEWLGELSQLQHLDLLNCRLIDRLPQSIQGLIALKRLRITKCSKSLLKRTRKETGEDWDKISHIGEIEITSERGICNMGHLKIQRVMPPELLEFDTSELELDLVDCDPEEEEDVVCDVSDANKINLKERGGSIKSLTYQCGGHEDEQLVEAMLEALQPHQNLQKLHIEKYDGSMFPSWTMSQMESFLPNLVKIRLEEISNCEHLPVLGQLPKLEEIVILKMPKVRIISEEFCGARNTTAGASFPSLKRLKLKDMWELEEWVTAGADGDRGAPLFPCLEDLTIAWCPKLRTIRPCIPPSLKRLSLSEKNLLHLLTFLGVPQMSLLKHLDIDDHQYSFPLSIRRLTSLETLKLSGCESITSFPKWLGELSQLQHLEIDECSLIDRLPQSIKRLTALKRLRITGCNQSLLERTRKETGKDWDKISHIGKIEITRDYYWDSSED